MNDSFRVIIEKKSVLMEKRALALQTIRSAQRLAVRRFPRAAAHLDASVRAAFERREDGESPGEEAPGGQRLGGLSQGLHRRRQRLGRR